MRILIVGLNPSRITVNNKSLFKLYSWCDKLSIENFSFINLCDHYDFDRHKLNDQYIKSIASSYDRVITLGRTASLALTKVEVEHFALPHPSGRNRKLNDPSVIETALRSCAEYIWKKNVNQSTT